MFKIILKYLLKMLKGKIPLIDGWYFIQGHFRESIYYSKVFGFLMRRHIREQIEFRFEHIDKECWNTGQCKICECSIPALTMCDKPCEKPCYPKMLSRKEWNLYKNWINYKN